MNDPIGATYYLSRKAEILAQYDRHALAWKPFLIHAYGAGFANAILKDSRGKYEAMIPRIPYIGGDENPMTRHLVRSTTSLVLYRVMKLVGKTPAEVGEIIFRAVDKSVNQLPPPPGRQLTRQFREQEMKLARKSQERRYPGDWVWEFVQGDGVRFDYGHDFLECGTQKLYHAYGADEFLPYYCYLDFLTERTPGFGFSRTQTLAEGHVRCDFRWKKGGFTRKGWPPPFAHVTVP